jgi:hypothetical protein
VAPNLYRRMTLGRCNRSQGRPKRLTAVFFPMDAAGALSVVGGLHDRVAGAALRRRAVSFGVRLAMCSAAAR